MNTSRFNMWPVAVLCTTLLVSGCVAQTPNLDATFGDAVNTATAQQVVNPDAVQQAAPPAGLDGQAAKATMDRYHKSFERPPVQSNAYTIGVSSVTTPSAMTAP